MGGTHTLQGMSLLLRDLNWQGKWADISHGNQQKTHARYGKWKITASCNSPVCGLTAHKSALQEGTRRVQRTIWTWVKKRTPEELNARAYQATPEHITFFVPPFFIAGLMLLWPKNHWQHYYVLEVGKGGEHNQDSWALSSEQVSLFALLEQEAFVFPFKLSWSQSTSVLSFLLFSLHPTGEGSEQDAGFWLCCWLRSACHRCPSTGIIQGYFLVHFSHPP